LKSTASGGSTTVPGGVVPAELAQPVERSTFSSCDPDETTQFFREMYAGNRTAFDHVAADANVVVDFAGIGPMRADRLRGGLSMRITADPLGYVLFGQLQRGRWTLHSAGEEANLGPGDCVLYTVDSPFRLTASDFDFHVVCLPLSRVTELAASHAGIDPHELRFESLAPISTSAARSFASTVALIHGGMSGREPAAAHPLVAEHLAQVAAAMVLTTFPNTTMRAEPPSIQQHVAPASIRRAVAFIEEHAHEPITVSDLAAATGLTGRAVQAGFRRHYGMTPTAYLRRVRLEHAHRELQAADPTSGVTVGRIALRWGFSHGARFTAFYREQYGVPPSRTLHGG
jgi:AraC-like DNA-binding protein